MPSSDADVVARVRARLFEALAELRLVRSRRRFVVAVSGGADSLCLLDALMQVLPNARRRLVVGHVDHRLRAESGADAAHVAQLAARYGVPAEVAVADVPAEVGRSGDGVEAAARRLRYSALATLAGRSGSASGGAVAVTGHTRDDHVETVLLHLVRGTGPRGLGGIRPRERLELPASGDSSGVSTLTLVRPLLGVTRAETTTYCAARGIRWLADPTNADSRFARNRIRHHLLPVLRTYNPAIDDAIVRLARVVADEDSWLDGIAARHRRALLGSNGAAGQIDVHAWARRGLPLRRRLVRQIGERLGRPELSAEAVERALAVGRPDGPVRAELGDGTIVTRSGGRLTFARAGEAVR